MLAVGFLIDRSLYSRESAHFPIRTVAETAEIAETAETVGETAEKVVELVVEMAYIPIPSPRKCQDLCLIPPKSTPRTSIHFYEARAPQQHQDGILRQRVLLPRFWYVYH